MREPGSRAQCGRARVAVFVALTALTVAASAALAPAEDKPQPQRAAAAALPMVGERFVPVDVEMARPAYQATFDDPADLKDWRLEGGRRMSAAGGNLVLESDGKDNHLVCWLTKEAPADFLLEFTVRPRDRKDGLNIVFFSARGLKGENVLDPALRPRTGKYSEYFRGDINAYHVSYWAAGRETAHLRKSKGFHLVTKGTDLVHGAAADAFQTVRVYKRGGHVRVMVDDVVAVAYDDDGKAYGPAHTHAGSIGLRQMGHTGRCEYGHVKVYPLKPRDP